MSTVQKSWIYMGLLDDKAVEFPWRFKVTDETLAHLLINELLHGNPVLLNEGYLVNNDFVSASVASKQGLLWELIDAGFVGVMHRGAGKYSLAEMPSKMAHIKSFRERTLRDDWPDLERQLGELDRRLEANGNLVPWPKFHSGSGYLALARRLLDRKASAHSLGIGAHVKSGVLHEFLSAYVGRMEGNLEGARDYWEQLVLRFANDPDKTNDRAGFERAMMNLANELYHYNMGLMLSAGSTANISVQTQTSPAFDDLLFPPGLRFLARDLSHAPRLHVPRSIVGADPKALRSILEKGSKVNQARAGWTSLRAAWEEAAPERRPLIEKELALASREYSARLAEHLGKDLKRDTLESLIDYSAGVAVTAATTAAGTALGGLPGGAIGFGIGYAVTRARKKVVGSVVRKYRVDLLEAELKISPALAEQSRRIVNAIKRRTAPSTIELPRAIASTFAAQLKPFG